MSSRIDKTYTRHLQWPNEIAFHLRNLETVPPNQTSVRSATTEPSAPSQLPPRPRQLINYLRRFDTHPTLSPPRAWRRCSWRRTACWVTASTTSSCRLSPAASFTPLVRPQPCSSHLQRKPAAPPAPPRIFSTSDDSQAQALTAGPLRTPSAQLSVGYFFPLTVLLSQDSSQRLPPPAFPSVQTPGLTRRCDHDGVRRME